MSFFLSVPIVPRKAQSSLILPTVCKDLQTSAQWPFFLHLSQIAALARQFCRIWPADFPQWLQWFQERGFLGISLESQDESSVINFGGLSAFTALTSFFFPVDSLKSFHIKVCCFLTASLCRAWLIAFGSVNSGLSWSVSDNFASIRPTTILPWIVPSVKVPKLQCSASVCNAVMNVSSVSPS